MHVMKVDYERVERMGQTHEDLTNKAEDHAMPRDVASAAAFEDVDGAVEAHRHHVASSRPCRALPSSHRAKSCSGRCQLQSHTRIIPLMLELELFNAWSRAVLLQTERRKNIIVLAQCRLRAVDVMCLRWSRDSLLIAFHSWTLFTQFRASLHHVHRLHIRQTHRASLMRVKRVFFGKMLLALHQTRHSRSMALAREMSQSRKMMCRAYDAWLRLSRMYRWRRHKIAVLMNASRMTTITTVFEVWVAEKQHSARIMQQERGRSKLQLQVMYSSLKDQNLFRNLRHQISRHFCSHVATR